MARARFSWALMAGALIGCVLLFVPQSYADSYARIVRLSDVDGKVQIDRNTGHGFEKAIPNMPITQGVRLQTGANGRAEVEFENGSALRMTGDSSVEFSQLSLRESGGRVNEVRVNDGTVYLHYQHKGDESFRVSFAGRDLNLTRDANFRLSVDPSDAKIAVFKGELQVDDLSEDVKVKKNQTLTLALNDPAQYELAKGITEYPTDDWDHQRAEYLDQYASNHNYGSPYRYGYSDLYRYGQFMSAPGYGLVWVPANVGFGWNPYSNGYWSYYPGTGYIFVSAFPWGWTPYRYGRWAWIPTFGGWAWVPGYWNHWNTGVAVVNPPPVWNTPTPPPPGSGTTVVVGPPLPRPHRNIRVEGPHQPVSIVPGNTVSDPNGPRGTPPTRVIKVEPGTPSPGAPAAAPAQPAAPVTTVRPSRPSAPPPSAPARQAAPPASPRMSAPPRMESAPRTMGPSAAPHTAAPRMSHPSRTANPK